MGETGEPDIINNDKSEKIEKEPKEKNLIMPIINEINNKKTSIPDNIPKPPADVLNIPNEGEDNPLIIEQAENKDEECKKITVEKNDVSEKETEEEEVKASPRKEEQKEEVTGKKVTEESDKTETILSSQSLKSSNPSISLTNDSVITPNTSTSQKNVKDKHLTRNQSDILPSLREVPPEEDASLMIFSHKGLPTKKYFKRREINSTVLPFGFNEKPSPSSTTVQPASFRRKAEVQLTPKISQRMPQSMTTKKMEAADAENKEKKVPLSDLNPNIPEVNASVSKNGPTGLDGRARSMRRKDGNPLLGVGYDEPVIANNTGRVPPGGFSSGLW